MIEDLKREKEELNVKIGIFFQRKSYYNIVYYYRRREILSVMLKFKQHEWKQNVYYIETR